MTNTNVTFRKVVVGAFLALFVSGCGDSGDIGMTTDLPIDGAGDLTGQEIPAADTTGTDLTTTSDQGRPDLGVPEDTNLVDGMICQPGDTQCMGSNFLECNEAGSDWITTVCEEGTTCTLDGCMATVCKPNETECDEDGNVITCLPDGSGFGEPQPCGEGFMCSGGECVPEACEDGDKLCAGSVLLVCVDGFWEENPCPDGWICFKEQCVECFSDDHCDEGMVCVDGTCGVPPVEVLTKFLPDGEVGKEYAALVEATGGDGDYTWIVPNGSLPDGLTLTADGTIAGIPEADGDFPFTVQAEDGGGMIGLGDLGITIHAAQAMLTILSKSPLPAAEEGSDYSFQFDASGGLPPYGWMIMSGGIPSGLGLDFSGLLSGVPSDHGIFDFTMRAVDAGDPIAFASANFQLEVKVAPLVIIGDQEINLFLTKAIILPLITVVQGIPIPYSTQLKAKGGVKPYHWNEIELPGFIKSFIPQAGIPDGLTLDDSGKLSGAVTDTSQVFELDIPFIGFKLTGFFFMAEVRDSQDPQDSDQAIYLIPTVPINLGGGLGL